MKMDTSSISSHSSSSKMSTFSCESDPSMTRINYKGGDHSSSLSSFSTLSSSEVPSRPTHLTAEVLGKSTTQNKSDESSSLRKLENTQRPSSLPPSEEGGYYEGLGNTLISSLNESKSAQKQDEDPFSGAIHSLSQGFSLLSGVLGEGARKAASGATLFSQKINEAVIVPTTAAVKDSDFKKHLLGYFSSSSTPNLSTYYSSPSPEPSSPSPSLSKTSSDNNTYQLLRQSSPSPSSLTSVISSKSELYKDSVLDNNIQASGFVRTCQDPISKEGTSLDHSFSGRRTSNSQSTMRKKSTSKKATDEWDDWN